MENQKEIVFFRDFLSDYFGDEFTDGFAGSDDIIPCVIIPFLPPDSLSHLIRANKFYADLVMEAFDNTMMANIGELTISYKYTKSYEDTPSSFFYFGAYFPHFKKDYLCHKKRENRKQKLSDAGKVTFTFEANKQLFQRLHPDVKYVIPKDRRLLNIKDISLLPDDRDDSSSKEAQINHKFAELMPYKERIKSFIFRWLFNSPYLLLAFKNIEHYNKLENITINCMCSYGKREEMGILLGNTPNAAVDARKLLISYFEKNFLTGACASKTLKRLTFDLLSGFNLKPDRELYKKCISPLFNKNSPFPNLESFTLLKDYSVKYSPYRFPGLKGHSSKNTRISGQKLEFRRDTFSQADYEEDNYRSSTTKSSHIIDHRTKKFTRIYPR